VATDLRSASEHWFDGGPLVPAILASASLPAVYPAAEVGGRTLIDGGVLNEVHTHRAVECGATELYVLHVGHLSDRAEMVVRPFDGAMRAYWTARRYRFNEDLRRVPPGCTIHLLPAGTTPRLRFDDFSRGPELAAVAYEQTVEYLRTGRSVRTLGPPAAGGRAGGGLDRADVS
jgi:NTE family protein